MDMAPTGAIGHHDCVADLGVCRMSAWQPESQEEYDYYQGAAEQEQPEPEAVMSTPRDNTEPQTPRMAEGDAVQEPTPPTDRELQEIEELFDIVYETNCSDCFCEHHIDGVRHTHASEWWQDKAKQFLALIERERTGAARELATYELEQVKGWLIELLPNLLEPDLPEPYRYQLKTRIRLIDSRLAALGDDKDGR